MDESEKGKNSNSWLLDQECTYYMCLKRERYSTQKPYDGGSVLMGNDVMWKTIGIGNIHMRIFDGQI